ncbi:MAG: hypothetical protein ACJAUH_000470 [Saprospiraceae bacterium]|jgi:hypothetical protein|tara:strand:- start:336 stop:440 length:105 start_codon:yes stop_codon:yes gene_type:complete
MDGLLDGLKKSLDKMRFEVEAIFKIEGVLLVQNA